MTDTITIDRRAPVGFKRFAVNWDDGSCGSILPWKMVDGRTWLIGSFHSRRVGNAGSRSVVPIDEIVDAADEVRGGSVGLNSFRANAKWIPALVRLPSGLMAAL